MAGEVGEVGWRMSEVERRSQELLILMFHSGVWLVECSVSMSDT